MLLLVREESSRKEKETASPRNKREIARDDKPVQFHVTVRTLVYYRVGGEMIRGSAKARKIAPEELRTR